MFLSLLLAAPVLSGLGCDPTNIHSTPQPSCVPPSTTIYSCEPISAGDGCVGEAHLQTDGAGGASGSPDRIFPVGCNASLPFCSPWYPNVVQTCSCQVTSEPDAAPTWAWICPL